MKRVLQLLVLLAVFPLTANALPLLYQEGTHFEIIQDKKSEKPEVREFFSFYCPHCFRFEPLIHDISPKLSHGKGIKKSHVNFLRGASPEVQDALTRAMIAGIKLGESDKVTKVIFEYIHKSRANFGSEKDVLNLLQTAGLDRAKFEKAMNSFTIKSEAKRMVALQNKLTQSGKLNSVPTLVVNGKYKIKMEALRSAKDVPAELTKLIEFLLTLD